MTRRLAGKARYKRRGRLMRVSGPLCRLAFLLVLARPAGGQHAPDLHDDHRALIGEVNHLVVSLGTRLWPAWDVQRAPFLLRSNGWEYLWRHPAPPGDFRPIIRRGVRDTIWVRPMPDTMRYEAAFPIAGAMTVVMSAPDAGGDPAEWVLTAAHELFHVHTGWRRQPNPFVGPCASMHELDFPFPFQDSTLNAAWRLEAEQLFQALTADSLTARIQIRLLPLSRRLQAALIPDTSVRDYKALIEWKEGVARYTERELARLASDTALYQPSRDFRLRFPSVAYGNTWNERYRNQLNPIRFVGQGVRGRTMFYYLGMGKAYLLDRLVPDWRERYLTSTLDAMIAHGISSLR